MSSHGGVFRGSVYDADDPEGRGRLRLMIPQVFGGAPSTWAEPTQAPSTKDVPEINDLVWVMFEGGDINRPIYVSRMTVNADAITNGAVSEMIDTLKEDADYEFIGPGTITSESLEDFAVVLSKIANGAVTPEKLNTPFHVIY